MRFGAGPLDITVDASQGPALALIASTLSLYDVEWILTERRAVSVTIDIDEPISQQARGDYLTCAQMLVDEGPGGLWATTTRGASLRGVFGSAGEAWSLSVPRRIADEGWWPEIEDLVSLIVTTGWRRAGWAPLHAAGLAKNGRGVLACAASRGGKTTFTLAMARRGWKVVGDDKLLLGTLEGTTVVAGVKHMLNVDPQAREWFPEVGDLSGRPLYSEWSPKRRVALDDIFPGIGAHSMLPTHLVELSRGPGVGGVRVHAMGIADAISVLLHQTVVPNEPTTARWITKAVAGLGQRLNGIRVELPDGIYEDDDALAGVEEALA